MNEQIKNYFENLRINSENDATKLSRGTLEAYWAYKLATQGCSIDGLCTITRPDIWGNAKEYPAIRIRLN